jgi:hypothetical protein
MRYRSSESPGDKIEEQSACRDKKPSLIGLQKGKLVLIRNERFKDPVGHRDPEAAEKEIEEDYPEQRNSC